MGLLGLCDLSKSKPFIRFPILSHFFQVFPLSYHFSFQQLHSFSLPSLSFSFKTFIGVFIFEKYSWLDPTVSSKYFPSSFTVFRFLICSKFCLLLTLFQSFHLTPDGFSYPSQCYLQFPCPLLVSLSPYVDSYVLSMGEEGYGHGRQICGKHAQTSFVFFLPSILILFFLY